MLALAVPRENQISKTLEGDVDTKFICRLNFKKQLLLSSSQRADPSAAIRFFLKTK